MTALWMVYGGVVAGALTLAALGVERGLVSWGRPTRHVWAVALAASLLLPLASATLPSSPGPAAAAGALPEVTVTEPGTAQDPVLSPSPGSVVMARALEIVRPVAARLGALNRPLALAWGVASTGALLALLLGVRAMARRRAGWRPRTVEGRPVLVAPDFGPAVVGVRRPEIVVPEWALRLERRLLRLVLLHEDAHRSAGDTLLLTAGVLAVAAAPWNPFLWWQLRRLRLAVEMDCDRRVLGRGVSRVTYGRLLLEVGRRQPRPGLAVAALAEPKGSLERRIHMIARRHSTRSLPGAVAALFVAALLVIAACETPTPTALEDALAEADMTVEDVIRLDGPGFYALSTDVLWVVDGDVTPHSDVLSEIDPHEIHRIEVVKGEAAVELWGERAQGGVIQIRTKEAILMEEPLEEVEVAGDGATEAWVVTEGEPTAVLRGRDITARTLISDDPPVIVVDGEVSELTPEEANALDIERIEVLRGAAARAILGERGAGGVIRITTRGGS